LVMIGRTITWSRTYSVVQVKLKFKQERWD